MTSIATRLRPLAFAAAAGLCVAATSAPAQEAETDPAQVIATVNGVEITQVDYDRASDELTDALQGIPEAQRHDYIIAYLTDLEVISQAAKEQGIDTQEEFKERMAFVSKRAMTEIFLARTAREAATNEAARALYEEQIASAEPQIEVRARHILVKTQEEAQKIRADLEGDANFESVAKEKSQDPGSARKGGDLGYFTRDRMVPEFAEVAFAMEPGTISDPVQSQFGWHVIKVENRREAPKPSYEDVEADLKTLAGRQAQRETVNRLREAADIEIVGEEAPAGEPGAAGEPEPEPAE